MRRLRVVKTPCKYGVTLEGKSCFLVQKAQTSNKVELDTTLKDKES